MHHLEIQLKQVSQAQKFKLEQIALDRFFLIILKHFVTTKKGTKHIYNILTTEKNTPLGKVKFKL